MRKLRSFPTWPLVAVTLSAAAIGGVLGKQSDSEPLAGTPMPVPSTQTTAAPASTVTSVRTVTASPRTPKSSPPTSSETSRTSEAPRTPSDVQTTQVNPVVPTTTATAPVTTTTKRPLLCDPSYPTLCLPLGAAPLKCSDIPDRDFPVHRPDRHRFDHDRNGVGCES